MTVLTLIDYHAPFDEGFIPDSACLQTSVVRATQESTESANQRAAFVFNCYCDIKLQIARCKLQCSQDYVTRSGMPRPLILLCLAILLSVEANPSSIRRLKVRIQDSSFESESSQIIEHDGKKFGKLF